MPEFIFSEFVETELGEIWDYIAKANLPAADHFLEAASRTFRDLAHEPGIGRVRNFSSPLLKNLRSFPIVGFNDYLIFYLPKENGIEVVHVLHGARDLENF